MTTGSDDGVDPLRPSLGRHHRRRFRGKTGDGSNGWGTTEYDAILVTGALPSIPDALKYQLCEGGRMVVVVGQAPAMTAYRVTRTTAASFETTPLFETVIKPLSGVQTSKFKF